MTSGEHAFLEFSVISLNIITLTLSHSLMAWSFALLAQLGYIWTSVLTIFYNSPSWNLVPDIMSSAPNINDIERGVLKQDSAHISFTVAVQHLDSPSSSSMSNLSGPQAISLPPDLVTLEGGVMNDWKKAEEFTRIPPIVNVSNPGNKKVVSERRVSRLIQFELWFNTYRLVSFIMLSSLLTWDMILGSFSHL